MGKGMNNLIKKGVVVSVILLFVSVSVIPSSGFTIEKKATMPTSFDGNTLYVGCLGPHCYNTIQDAIDDASAGDTVFVYDDSSPYYENVIVDKSINLIGENRDTTVIDGSGDSYVVYVSVNDVNISGFTICNNNKSFAGIKIISENNSIYWNNIEYSDYGVILSYTSHNKIKQNIIKENEGGILIWRSSNNDITSNVFKNHIHGISTWNDAMNYIFENIFEEHTEIAIKLVESTNNNITGNLISNNSRSGIGIWHSHNQNLISGNSILRNNISGINLWNCSNQKIISNNIEENYNGILLEESNINLISNNNFKENNISTFFINCIINKWKSNYWERPRLLPYPIFGKMKLGNITFPWLNFDWNPAREPYDIEGGDSVSVERNVHCHEGVGGYVK